MSPHLRPSALYDAPPANASLAVAAGFALRRASTHEDWMQVRALRSAALHGRGETAERVGRSHGDDYDAAPDAHTYLLWRNARAVGSTRSNAGGAVPAWEVFAPAIEAALGTGATIVEASLTVVDPRSPTDPKVALFHLFKAHMLRCHVERADWLVVVAPDSQMGFYRRMLNMEILTGAEQVPGVASPRVVMGLDYRRQAAPLFKRIPLLSVTPAEAVEYARSGAIAFNAGEGPSRSR